MPLVEINLEVEDIAFIPIMKVLHNLPGVAKVHFDLDQLGKPRGGARGQRKTNGHAAHDLSVAEIIVRFLDSGDKHISQIRDALASAGFSPNTANDAMTKLRNAGHAERRGEGVWGLADQMKTAMAKQQPTLALPAPNNKRPYIGHQGFNSRYVILEALQKAGKPIDAKDIKPALAAAQYDVEGVYSGLDFWMKKGAVKRVDKGIYEVTAAGRKVKLPPKEQENG